MEILVEDPSRLELWVVTPQGLDEHPRSPIQLLVGAERTSIIPKFFGSSGKLAVHDNVEWTVGDELKVLRAGPVVPTALTVSGGQPGDTTATVRLGTFEREVAIQVIGP